MTDDGSVGRGALVGQAGRFLVLGGANTAATTAAFYGLSFLVRPSIAFTLVYATGLIFVTVTTPRFVFGTRASHRRKAALITWYLGVYLCGLAVIRVLTHDLSAPRGLVVLGTLLVTTPLNFVGARWLVGSQPPSDRR